MRATKFLYKEPARAPINLRLPWDNGPYVPINLVLLAELQTVELFMYLARSHTWWNSSKTRNKSVKTAKVCEAIVCLLLAVGDWVQDVIPKYGISKSWAVFRRWSRAGGNELLCRFDIYFFFLWEERVDNLCAIDLTCLLFDFVYKLALNHSSFINYAVCVPINVISLYSN